MEKKTFEAKQGCHIPGVRSFKAGERVEVEQGGYLNRMLTSNPYFTVVVVKQKEPEKKSGRKRRNKKSR